MLGSKVLIRARSASPATLDFAGYIERLSRCEAVLLLDERGGEQACEGFRKIGLTQTGLEELGLYCPPDFAWRCGDYGLYLAATRLEDCPCFWLIEDDVRILGDDPAAFFRFCETLKEIDFLAGGFRPAETEWYWHHNSRGRGVRPFRCFFPVTRYSRRAVDLLRAKRQSHSQVPMRRRLWANDEGFVATVLANSPLRGADFNDFGPTFYRDETFAYRDAEAAVAEELRSANNGAPRLVHPVRLPSELQARSQAIIRQDTRTFRSRLKRRATAIVVARLPW